jgi:hypothetical protein
MSRFPGVPEVTLPPTVAMLSLFPENGVCGNFAFGQTATRARYCEPDISGIVVVFAEL